MNRAASPPETRGGRAIPAWGWPIAVLRLVLLLAALASCAPLFYLVMPFVRRNPVPRWFLRLVCVISGVQLAVVGTRPARKTFFLANHVSWIDIPAIAGVTGSAFIAHDGLAAIGPLRWLCSLNDTVFVARHDRRSVGAQIEQVRQALRETGALTIFPEGTTSDGSGLLPLKSSLLSALDSDADHIPIQPVWLDYGPETRRIAWTGNEPGVDNFLWILSRWRPVTLTMHFLPPLAASERTDRKAVARATELAIRTAKSSRG